MRGVDVLELVDEHMAEPPALGSSELRIAVEGGAAQEQQVVEVDHPAAPLLLLVGGVDVADNARRQRGTAPVGFIWYTHAGWRRATFSGVICINGENRDAAGSRFAVGQSDAAILKVAAETEPANSARAPLMASITESRGGRTAPVRPVPKRASTIQSAVMSRSRKDRSSTEPPCSFTGTPAFARME